MSEIKDDGGQYWAESERHSRVHLEFLQPVAGMNTEKLDWNRKYQNRRPSLKRWLVHPSMAFLTYILPPFEILSSFLRWIIQEKGQHSRLRLSAGSADFNRLWYGTESMMKRAMQIKWGGFNTWRMKRTNLNAEYLLRPCRHNLPFCFTIPCINRHTH